MKSRPNHKLFYLTAIFIASASFALAGTGSSFHWESAGWDGGGCYPNVEFDPHVQNRVYLISDVAGIWRSDDLGERWYFATRGLQNLNVSLLVAAPSEPDKLYAGTAGGLFHSIDGAKSWHPTDTAGGRIRFRRPDSHRSIAVSETDASRLAAGTSGGEVYYSKDSGEHWKLLGDRRPFGKPVPISALRWIESESILYASSAEGLAVFSFRDSKWTLLGKSPKPITDLWAASGEERILYAAGQNKLFISRDGAKTWKTGSAIPKGIIYRILNPDHREKILLVAWNDGWKGGIARSDDEGATWKDWDKTMNADLASNPTRVWAMPRGRINAIKMDPFNSNVLFRTDWWGVWRSDDGGVTWNEKIKGAPNTVASDIALSKDGHIYVATMDNGLLRSADGGKTYEPLFPAKGYADDINGHVWRVLPVEHGIYATSSPWAPNVSQVIFGREGSADFYRSRKGLPARRPKVNTLWGNGYIRAIAAHPSEPDTVYVGLDGDDGGGFYISKDGGRSWTRPKNQPGSLSIYNGLAVDAKDPRRILWGAAGKKGGIFLSEDGAATWRLAVSPDIEVFDVIFGREPGSAYAAGQDGRHDPVLYVSKDGGSHWTLLKKFEGKGSAEALRELPDGRIVLGILRWNNIAPGLIYLGSKDGLVWEEISGDLPEGEGPAAFAYDDKNKMLYLALKLPPP